MGDDPDNLPLQPVRSSLFLSGMRFCPRPRSAALPQTGCAAPRRHERRPRRKAAMGQGGVLQAYHDPLCEPSGTRNGPAGQPRALPVIAETVPPAR